MSKILFILGRYLPEPSPNGICVGRVAEELAKNHKVYCLVAKLPGLDETAHINGVEVFRCNLRFIERAVKWCENRKEKKYAQALLNLLGMANKVKLLFMLPFYPYTSFSWKNRLVRKAEQLHSLHKFDCIIGVHLPFEALKAVQVLKRKHPDIVSAYYFLDSLSVGIPWRGLSRRFQYTVGCRREKQLFPDVDLIMVQKNAYPHYIGKFHLSEGHKIVPVCLPLFSSIAESPFPVEFDRNKVNIVYTGSMVAKVRNPYYFLEIFKIINKGGKYVLHLFGDIFCKKMFIKCEKDLPANTIIYYGKVGLQHAYAAMQKADILLNIGSRFTGMMPSKIFEYMACGKPIVSFYAIDDEPGRPYLEKYPNCLQIKEEPHKLNENAKNVEAFMDKAYGKSVRYEYIESLFYENTPKATAELIEKKLYLENKNG